MKRNWTLLCDSRTLIVIKWRFFTQRSLNEKVLNLTLGGSNIGHHASHMIKRNHNYLAITSTTIKTPWAIKDINVPALCSLSFSEEYSVSDSISQKLGNNCLQVEVKHSFNKDNQETTQPSEIRASPYTFMHMSKQEQLASQSGCSRNYKYC